MDIFATKVKNLSPGATRTTFSLWSLIQDVITWKSPNENKNQNQELSTSEPRDGFYPISLNRDTGVIKEEADKDEEVYLSFKLPHRFKRTKDNQAVVPIYSQVLSKNDLDRLKKSPILDPVGKLLKDMGPQDLRKVLGPGKKFTAIITDSKGNEHYIPVIYGAKLADRSAEDFQNGTENWFHYIPAENNKALNIVAYDPITLPKGTKIIPQQSLNQPGQELAKTIGKEQSEQGIKTLQKLAKVATLLRAELRKRYPNASNVDIENNAISLINQLLETEENEVGILSLALLEEAAKPENITRARKANLKQKGKELAEAIAKEQGIKGLEKLKKLAEVATRLRAELRKEYPDASNVDIENNAINRINQVLETKENKVGVILSLALLEEAVRPENINRAYEFSKIPTRLGDLANAGLSYSGIASKEINIEKNLGPNRQFLIQRKTPRGKKTMIALDYRRDTGYTSRFNHPKLRLKAGDPIKTLRIGDRVIIPEGGETFTIVLDPGHGGRDPGARKYGVAEKDVVLTAANDAAAFLESRGFKVILTRTNDRFIPLSERPKFADKAHAFHSVHADYSRNANSRGPSVHRYTGNGNDQAEIQLSRRAVKALREYAKGSWEPGEEQRVKPTRKAKFTVLKPLAPAVVGTLIELGFITNLNDSLLLRGITPQGEKKKITIGTTLGMTLAEFYEEGRYDPNAEEYMPK